MQDFDTSIRNIKSLEDARQIASSLMAETTTAHHVTENDPVWTVAEEKLLTIILLCSAEHCPQSESPLSYARNLVNQNSGTIGEKATTEEAKAAWNDFSEITTGQLRAGVFAGLASRLKSLK